MQRRLFVRFAVCITLFASLLACEPRHRAEQQSPPAEVTRTNAPRAPEVQARGTSQREVHPALGEHLATSDDAAAAVKVLESYYAAIGDRDYERAYRFWGGDAPQSFDEFRRGFADTATVRMHAGAPSQIGAAAGSRYIDVPVTIVATTKEGAEQHFSGTYTLRRSVVDGATAAQREWHLYRGSIRADR